MPPKARAKKDLGDSPASWREDQRRLRNRLSQKAVRERRAARIQQLEQQLAAVTKGEDSVRVTELLNTNSKLRHALLDTRKKLASLSATATQLGDRIKLVLDDEQGKHEAAQDSENSVPNQIDIFDDQTYNLWRNSAQTCVQSPPTSSTESIPISQEPDQFPPHDHIELINPDTDVEVEATYINPLSEQHDKTLVCMDDAMFHAIGQHESIPAFFPGPQSGPKLRVFTGSTFSQHLDHIHGLLRLGGALESGSSMPQVVEHMVAAFIECAWPSVKDWFDVTQSRSLAHRVLWWQTSTSQEAATQVPPGNTPTLIQLSRPKYPCILDWVPHPGMRDRLILDYESYDVDQVISDMTNSFVVEVEDTRPVFDDAYPGQALPIVGNGYSCHLMEIVERSLGFGPIDDQSQQELTVLQLLRSMSSSAKYSSMDHHPIHRFKLDPRFFDKYPGLYDANAESKYRPKNPNFAQRSQRALPFTTETVNQYMNAALRAKSSLVGA